MKKPLSLGTIFLFLTLTSLNIILPVFSQFEQNPISLPYTWEGGLTCYYLDLDLASEGYQQVVTVKPGEIVDTEIKFQRWSGAGNPSEINQVFLKGRVVAGPWDCLIKPYLLTNVGGWMGCNRGPLIENKLLVDAIRWLGEIQQELKVDIYTNKGGEGPESSDGVYLIGEVVKLYCSVNQAVDKLRLIIKWPEGGYVSLYEGSFGGGTLAMEWIASPPLGEKRATCEVWKEGSYSWDYVDFYVSEVFTPTTYTLTSERTITETVTQIVTATATTQVTKTTIIPIEISLVVLIAVIALAYTLFTLLRPRKK